MPADPPPHSVPPPDRPSPPSPLGDLEDAYLRRSISELSALQAELADLAQRDGGDVPVHPSGSPRAEIFILKWGAGLGERQEGVAFFGRSGDAILKSVQRLGLDPLLLYGTLCAKREEWTRADSLPWLARELAIVRPKLLMPMGERAVDAVNALEMPLSAPIANEPGSLQQWTPATEAIVVPDIDDSLDEQHSKKAFWAAFRALGDWYSAQPPY